MKHLITILALVVAVNAGAQGTTIHEYPWNPDWDNDNFVGTSDLTGFLSAFGSEFGNPPEPCEYFGGELESWLLDVNSGTIILDSVFIELELEDVTSYYVMGCPDSIVDTVVVATASILTNVLFTSNAGWQFTNTGGTGNGSVINFGFFFDGGQGQYEFELTQSATAAFVGDGFFGYTPFSVQTWSYLPFPADWTIDTEGIHLTWPNNGWTDYLNYLHIIPYWHYAE